MKMTGRKVWWGCFGVLAVLLVSVNLAGAAPITVLNYSFESPVIVVEGSWNTNVTDWDEYNAGGWNPTTTNYPGGVPDGNNCAWVNASVGSPRWIYQTLSATLVANYQYTLQVYVGRRVGYTLPSYRVELVAGSTTVASESSLQPSAGTFLQSTTNYTSPAPGNPLIGQNLMVRLSNLGGPQPNFDLVTLNGAPVPTPTPATLLLLGTGLLGLVILRFRQAPR